MKRSNYKKNSTQKALIISFALIVIFLAVIPVFKGFSSTKVPDNAISVELSMQGFSPNEITVSAGDTVDLYLINLDNKYHSDGGGWHQFAIDELNIDFNVGPKINQLVSFTPTEPGTYYFYCDVCCGGKENPYMQGTLVVR